MDMNELTRTPALGKRLILASLALVALALLLCFRDAQPAHAALPTGSTITVGNTGDSNTADSSISLREAILLATDTGNILGRPLTQGECTAISDGQWDGSSCVCVVGGCHHGKNYTDTINFSGVFSGGPPVTITLTGVLPELNTGSDIIDGWANAVNVVIAGVNHGFNCLNITSGGNEVLGHIGFQHCQTAISVRSSMHNIIGFPGLGPVTIEDSSYAGVELYESSLNTIQSATIGSSNVGIYITGSGSHDNSVVGNFIGNDGTTANPNNNGVLILSGAHGNTIGGTTPAARNIISGNGNWGVGVNAGGGTGNVVEGNYIGTNVAGTTAMANQLTGVALWAPGNRAEHNVIAGNSFAGVEIFGASVSGSVVSGNYIGTNAAGSSAIPNGTGVTVENSSDNKIGGVTAGDRNVISGNTGDGVDITGASSSGNTVSGNYIGTDSGGSGGLPNVHDGVQIEGGAHSNIIGAGATSVANVISGNGANGVEIDGVGTNGNLLSQSSIYGNTGLGIDLKGDGVTPNDDPADADTGPNDLQNFPELSGATKSGATTTVLVVVPGPPGVSFTVEFFSNGACDSPGGNGEGQTYLGNLTTMSGQTFIRQFSTLNLGDVVTATATRQSAPLDTSEFSACITVTAGSTVTSTPSPTPSPTPTHSPTPSPTPSPTATPTPSPTPTPTGIIGMTRTWGDGDCSGAVAPRDGQADLNHFLGKTELSQTQPCPVLGSTVAISGVSYVWGDFDCSGPVAPRDGQAALNYFLGTTELSQNQPCPAVGATVQVVS